MACLPKMPFFICLLKEYIGHILKMVHTLYVFVIFLLITISKLIILGNKLLMKGNALHIRKQYMDQ